MRDNPDDDTPRLILADWLDEYGEPERAELIRVQCELARREATPLDEPCRCTRDLTLAAYQAGVMCGPCQRRLPPVRAPRARSRALLRTHASEWFDSPHHDLHVVNYHDHKPTLVMGQSATPRPWLLEADVTRGFISRVSAPLAALWADRACERCGGEGCVSRLVRVNLATCPSCDIRLSERPNVSGGAPSMWCPRCWWTHPPIYETTPCPHCRGTGRVSGPTPALVGLVAAEPVERVEVTDRVPNPNSYGGPAVAWQSDPNDADLPSWVPYPLLALMDDLDGRTWLTYPTREIALQSLSAALLDLARAAGVTA